MKERDLPHVYIGSLLRFDPADVRAWVEASKDKDGGDAVNPAA